MIQDLTGWGLTRRGQADALNKSGRAKRRFLVQTRLSSRNFLYIKMCGIWQEGYSTRSKPLIVLAVLMLSVAATALAQTTGNESGTGQMGVGNEDNVTSANPEPIATASPNKSTPEETLTEKSTTTKTSDSIKYILSWVLAIIGTIGALIAIYEFLYKRRIENKRLTTEENTSITTESIRNIPLSHNPNFTGRVDLLEKLQEALRSGERAAVTDYQAITGLGGVGKTQLALEYAYRHMGNYKVIWWVRSEDTATLAVDYAGLAVKLDLPEKTSRDQSVIIAAVKSWLEQNDGWLLVFDNAQNPEDIKDYLPKVSGGHVIITSRESNWGGTAKTLPVDVFSREESIEFLRKRTGGKDGAEALADALGDLPLALEQAGAYIEETGITLSDYLERFQEEQTKVLKRGNPSSYPATVATTWEISFKMVQDESDAGADLLRLCAFLAPDNIPKPLLVAGAERLPEPLASAVKTPLEFDGAVAAPKRYSLLTVANDSISVHRLVQAVVRDQLPEKERKRWAEAAVQLVNDAFPQEGLDVRTWPECSLLLPHAIAAAGHAEGLGAAKKETQHLLNQAGLYLNGRAEFKVAEALYERALLIAEIVYGREHQEVATIINNLGGVLKDMGDITGAKELYERALKIDEKTLGSDHPNVARDTNNLGLVLQDMGDLEGAKELYERALKIDEKTLGSDHPTVAIRVNNLGGVLKDMGDLEGAKLHLERALKIDEKALGPDHPNAATIANNLGMVLKDMGDLEGAKLHLERALKIDEKALGPDHPNVAIRVNNLGMVLKDMGDLEGAKLHLERALKIDEKALGPDHPQVAIYANNLGTILQDMGDLAGAKELYERALKIGEKVYGPDHPHVATCANNLGLALKDMGDLAGAKELYERALKIGEKAYGPDHPQVAIYANNLGMVLQDMGDLAGANELFERALKIDEKTLGPDHPQVANYANNLGNVLQDMGDLASAKELFERALKIDEKTLGPDHPNVARDVNNLGGVLKDMGDLAGAKELFERSLKIFRDRMGENHPRTATVQGNIDALEREIKSKG